MKTNETQQTEQTVQPQKRTKCFWDLESALAYMRYDYNFPKGIKENSLNKFFQSLKRFEAATNTKLDITLLATDSNLRETKTEFEGIQFIFDNLKMNNRIKDCRCRKDIFDSVSSKTEKELWNKEEAVSEYYKKHEENLDDIAMCIYAGGKAEDHSMANHHRRGNVYRGIPHAYINTGKSDLHYSSLYNTKGDAVNLPASGKENYQALTSDLNSIADIFKPKLKLSNLIRKKENIDINLR